MRLRNTDNLTCILISSFNGQPLGPVNSNAKEVGEISYFSPLRGRPRDIKIAETTKNIYGAKGEGAFEHNTVTRLFKKFLLGCKNFDNRAGQIDLKPWTPKTYHRGKSMRLAFREYQAMLTKTSGTAKIL